MQNNWVSLLHLSLTTSHSSIIRYIMSILKPGAWLATKYRCSFCYSPLEAASNNSALTGIFVNKTALLNVMNPYDSRQQIKHCQLLHGRCKGLSAIPPVPWKSLSVQNCCIVPSQTPKGLFSCCHCFLLKANLFPIPLVPLKPALLNFTDIYESQCQLDW